MKDVVEDEIIKKLSGNCNRNVKIINIMLEECKREGYNIEESENFIKTIIVHTLPTKIEI